MLWKWGCLMKASFIDTNFIIRFLVETPDTIPKKFAFIFSFFEKLERGEVKAELSHLVLFESFFVLKSFYKVPQKEISKKFLQLISFKGLHLEDKSIIQACLHLLLTKPIGVVDAYLIAASKSKGLKHIYSFDAGFKKHGLTTSGT
jgi:predicted nucleic-acid-binding protein